MNFGAGLSSTNIEDFWGLVKNKVYEDNWEAKNLQKLEVKITKWIQLQKREHWQGCHTWGHKDKRVPPICAPCAF